MKKYITVFRIRFINSLQYRAAAFGEILKSFAWAFMEILAYTALYRTAGNAFPMEFSQPVSYVWMQQILFLMYSVVFGDEEIYTAIGSGSIASTTQPMSATVKAHQHRIRALPSTCTAFPAQPLTRPAGGLFCRRQKDGYFRIGAVLLTSRIFPSGRSD